jgi:hypothetical protein
MDEFDSTDIGHSSGVVLVEHLGLVHASVVAGCYCQSTQCVDCLLCAKGDSVAASRSVQVLFVIVGHLGISPCS